MFCANILCNDSSGQQRSRYKGILGYFS
uniref:Uncharacterized protein n=1 Tax=Arundo donax TaxID=35708 RepID=A0A0A9BY52_ARUDO